MFDLALPVRALTGAVELERTAGRPLATLGDECHAVARLDATAQAVRLMVDKDSSIISRGRSSSRASTLAAYPQEGMLTSATGSRQRSFLRVCNVPDMRAVAFH